MQHGTRERVLNQEDHLPVTQESKNHSLVKSSGSQFPDLQRKTLISKDPAMIWHEWVTCKAREIKAGKGSQCLLLLPWEIKSSKKAQVM